MAKSRAADADCPGATALFGAQVVLQAVLAASNRLELPPGVLLRLGG